MPDRIYSKKEHDALLEESGLSPAASDLVYRLAVRLRVQSSSPRHVTDPSELYREYGNEKKGNPGKALLSVASVAALFLAVFLFSPFRGAQTPSQAGRIVNQQGKVLVYSGTKVLQVSPGSSLPDGAVIRTGSDAFIDIVQGPMRVRVHPSSRVSLHGSDGRHNELLCEITEGSLSGEAETLKKGDRFEVVTGMSVVTVRGTLFAVTSNSRKGDVVEVYDGAVKVASRGLKASDTAVSSHVLRDNQQVILRRNAEPLSSSGNREIPEPRFLEPAEFTMLHDTLEFMKSADTSPHVSNGGAAVSFAVVPAQEHARIFIDGRLLTREYGNMELQEGEYLLTVKADGYYDASLRIKVKPGMSDVHVALHKQEKPAGPLVHSWLALWPEKELVLKVNSLGTVVFFREGEELSRLTLPHGVFEKPERCGDTIILRGPDRLYVYALDSFLVRASLPLPMRYSISNERLCLAGDDYLELRNCRGEKLWRVAIHSFPVAQPVFSGDFVFLPLSGGELRGFHAATGLQVIRYNAGDEIGHLGLYQKDLLIATSETLQRFSPHRDEALWVVSFPAEDIRQTLAVPDGVVLIYGTATLSFFSSDGEARWTRKFSQDILSGVHYKDKKLFIPTRGAMKALDVVSGETDWSLVVEGVSSENAVYNGSALTVGTSSGSLRTFR